MSTYTESMIVISSLGFLETASLKCFRDSKHAQALQEVVHDGFQTLARLRGAGLHIENGRMSARYIETLEWIAFALQGLRGLTR